MFASKWLVAACVAATVLLAACGGGGSTTTTCSLSGISPNVKQTMFIGTAVATTPIPISAASGCSLSYQAVGLPPGLTMNASNGFVSGVPTTSGVYNGTIGISTSSSDKSGNTVGGNFSYTVIKPAVWSNLASTTGMPGGITSVQNMGGVLYAVSSALVGTNYVPQVWTSVNQGSSWTNTNAPSPLAGGSLRAYAVANDGSRLYLMGGIVSSSGATTATYSNAVYSITAASLATSSPTWVTATTAAFGTAPRAFAAATFMGGALYVTGGQVPSGSTAVIDNAVFRSTNQGASWTSVAGIAGPTQNGHCLTNDGSTLYSIGGSNSLFASTNNGVSWTQRSTGFLAGSTGVACAVAGSTLYATGGSSSTSDFNSVYQSTDGGTTWVTEPSGALTVRSLHGMAVNAAGNLVVVGGFRSTTALTDVWLGSL